MVVVRNCKLATKVKIYPMLRRRIVALAVIFYFLLCFLLGVYSNFTSLPILSVIPVIVLAWLYGTRLGVLAGLVCFPVNVCLLTILGIDWIDNMVKTGGGLLGSLSLVVIGFIVGRLSDLSTRLRDELSNRNAVDQELLLHRENLEQLVNEKVRDLRESQERFRAITDNSPDAIIITDIFGVILYCNKGVETIFGCAQDELLGQNSVMLLPADKRDEEKSRRDSMALSGMHAAITFTIESDMVRKDGTEFPVEFSLYSWSLEGDLFYSMSIRDITQRKQAEDSMLAASKALQRSRDFFQNVFDSSADGIYVTDERGIITFANKALSNMLGYDYRELIGLNAIILAGSSTIMPKDDAEEEELYLLDYSDPFETVVEHKDGTRLPVESRVTSVPGDSKSGAGLIVTLRDITERKQAEEEIRRARDFLETMFKASPDAIMAVDAVGIITAANDSVFDVYGYRPEELIGQHISVIPDDGGQASVRHAALIGQLQKNGMVRGFEETRTHKDGHVIHVETSLAQLKNFDGTPSGAVSSTRDITGRKKLEMELQRSRDYLEMLFMASPDAIIVCNDTGTIIMANDSVYDVYGYRPEEIIGGHASLFTPQDENQLDAIKESLEELFAKGIMRGLVNERRCKDGRIFWAESSHVLLKNKDGSLVGTVSSSRDITERRRMEDELRQAQKMEAIGTLAGGIAHDFNNILGAIIGYCELSQHDDACAPQIRSNLDQVLNAAERARNLVKQILAFSRKSQSEVKPLQVHLIIKEALKLMRASLPANIEIIADLTDKHDVVLADATQVHQVLVNLCTNAAHAMERSGGVMTIGLEPVELQDADAADYSDVKPGHYIRLTVSDTGMGIEQQNISRIFEPFFTTKDVGKGTGMGLAVVHGIVKSLKGDITVNSDQGSGTVFHVLLPRQNEDVTAGDVVIREPPRGHESVLLVDDELALMDVGAHMLRSLGYQVTAVRRPQEALELFALDPHAFDLVFTDQAMPGLSGFEFAQQVLGLRPDIPVVLCTGYSEMVNEEAALGAGIKAFVVKPLSRLKIGETLRRVLGDTKSG